MEKTYKVAATAITGKHGQTFRKDDEVPHSHLINHQDHLNGGHIVEIDPEATREETAQDPLKEVTAARIALGAESNTNPADKNTDGATEQKSKAAKS